METTTPQALDSPPANSRPLVVSITAWRILWILYAIAWTTALEVPVPIDTVGHPEWQAPVFTFSKCVHLSAFTLFVYLGARMCLPGNARWPLLAFFFGHAMLTEYLQYLLYFADPKCSRDSVSSLLLRSSLCSWHMVNAIA